MTQVSPWWTTSRMASILVPYRWPSRSPCSTSLETEQSHHHHNPHTQTHLHTHTPAAARHVLKLLPAHKVELSSWLLAASDWPSSVCRKDGGSQLVSA